MEEQASFRTESLGTSIKIYVIGSMIVKALGLIRSIGFARLLGPEQFGVFVICYSLVTILEPMATIGLSASLLRFSSNPSDSKKILLCGFFASLAITSLFLLLAPTIGSLLKVDNRVLLILSILSLVPYGFYHLLYSSYQGLRNFFMAVIVQFTYLSFFTIGGIVAIKFIKADALTAINMHIAGCLLTALFVIPILFFRSKAKSSLVLKAAVIYGLFTVAIDMGFEAYRYIDRYVINWYLDSSKVGVFSAAYTLAMIPMMIGSVLGETLLPHLSTVFDRGEKERGAHLINVFIKVILIIGIFIVGLVGLFKRPIIELLYGAKYIDGAQVLPVLTAYSVVFASYNILFLYFFLLKKPQMGILTTAVGLISSFLFNVFFVPKWGVSGAAWATFCSGLVLLALLVTMTRFYKFNLDAKILVCIACLIVIPLEVGIYIFAPIGLALWLVAINKSERTEIVRIIKGEEV